MGNLTTEKEKLGRITEELECEEIVKRRKEKLNTWKKSQTLSDFIEYKRSIAEVRRVTRRKKRECFHNFCNNINKFSSLSYVWNTMRIFKNTKRKIEWNA